jgi:ergothioneine biosynthesis protein EgtB
MSTIERSTTLLSRYQKVRNISERLCKNLETEDYVIQPIECVSPPKWHLAHTTWFFETLILCKYVSDYKVFHESYNYIFNSYYESLGPRVGREYRGTLSRPTVKDVFKYRFYVDEQMQLLLKQEVLPDSLLELIELGIQHEQQHQELLIYDIKYILFSNPLKPTYFNKLPGKLQKNATVPFLDFVEITGGVHSVGYGESEFAWDNERPSHKTYFENFNIGNRLITNGEYLNFMRDNGYTTHNWWLNDGWKWVNQWSVNSPLYWVKNDGEWFEFTLYGLNPLNPSLPVTHISFYEAMAFAAWSDRRLLTEYEWEVAARLNGKSLKNGNFMESDYFHPVPAKQDYLINQMFGDVWEWTSSAYQPYPGYTPYAGPLGEYNGKFMINQVVLRGGCCATPQDHIRPTYRNFFQPEHRWLFSGIRLATK